MYLADPEHRRSRSWGSDTGLDEIPPATVQPSPQPDPEIVTVEEMADGVYLLGGGPINSYMVEFADWVAVFEAPINERNRAPEA